MRVHFLSGSSRAGDYIDAKGDPMRYGRALLSIAVCLAGVVIAFFAFRQALIVKKLLDQGIKVEGVVVEVLNKTSTRDGRSVTEYTSRVKYFDSKNQEFYAYRSGHNNLGAKFEMIYDPENPSSHIFSRSQQSPLLPYFILLGISALMAFGGALAFAFWLKARAHVKQLMSNGKKVMAKIKDIRIQEITRRVRRRHRRHSTYSISIGGSNPDYIHTYTSQIVAEHEDQLRGGSQIFLSPPIPGQLSDVFVGKEIPVYVNPKDPSDYYMGMPCLRAAGIR